MNVKSVAVLGAGNGGVTAAADLKSRGFEVRLYELPEFKRNIEGIIKKGGILLKKKESEVFVSPDLVTTDISKAIEGADIVMLTVPAFAVEAFAKLSAPFITEDQIVFINGAASVAPIRFVNAAREIGITTDFKIAEANSLTYGTRAFPDTAEVELSLEVKLLYLSAYPSKNTDVCLQACKQIYDYLVPASNIWEVLLRNGNPESHPGPCLLNAGRIEYSGDDFALYTQGITEHTVNIVESIQNERIALGKALGFELDTAAVARVKRGYFETSEGPLDKLFSESKVFSQITGPSSLTSRYFIEDISMGLVLWSDLGKALTVNTPVIDSVIHLGGALLKKDYYADGLTLDKLGFEFADKEQLIFKVS